MQPQPLPAARPVPPRSRPRGAEKALRSEGRVRAQRSGQDRRIGLLRAVVLHAGFPSIVVGATYIWGGSSSQLFAGTLDSRRGGWCWLRFPAGLTQLPLSLQYLSGQGRVF